MALLIPISTWFASLALKDKIIGAIISFFAKDVLEKARRTVQASEVDKAYKKALKKWSFYSFETCYYEQHKLRTIVEFAEYIVNNHGGYNPGINQLFEFFKAELDKTTEGKLFLRDLRMHALNKDQFETLSRAAAILENQQKNHDLLESIQKELNIHNKGKRVFDEIEGYIPRTCSMRMNSEEEFKYLLAHKTLGKYTLSDIVLGKTACSGNKFALYSDAQTGKSTELLKLGRDLQEGLQLTPILFKVRGCHSIKQELPSLNAEIEKGLVVIIDALDEKFEGDARFGIYHEIDSYAEEHPDTRIVVSCRENFSGEFTFHGFTELSLNDLSWQDAVSFLTDAGLKGAVSKIENKKLYEFVRTPFHLKALADYYKQNKTFPDNKGELYEFFIDRRLGQEEDLRLKENAEMLVKGKALLQRMGVVMQLMTADHLTKEELLNLFDNNYEDYNRIQRSGLIEEEDKKYCFSHNSFKEFFVSKYLLGLNNLEQIQERCCYKGTKIVRIGWNNTVALMLAQLPKKSELSGQILAWIVNDNKDLVLYIDRSLFDAGRRTAIFKDIVSWHKAKNLRIADIGSSKYEDLMNFGHGAESLDYLMKELEDCREMDAHTVNLLYLARYVRREDLATGKSSTWIKLLLEIFARFSTDENHIYVLFEVFRNPWLRCEENVDVIYHILKDCKQPYIVNHLVEYLTDVGFAEKYIDDIIDKSKYIHNYDRDGCIHIVSRSELYDAYRSLTSWESIRKVLVQLTEDYKQHRCSCGDPDKSDELLADLLEKVGALKDAHPEAPDTVYEMLLELAERRSCARRIGKDVFFGFFDNNGLSQKYFEKSVESLRRIILDGQMGGEKDDVRKSLESNSYCAALLLNEDRLAQVESSLDYDNPNGEGFLSWLEEYATQDVKNAINVIRKKHYPALWRDRTKPYPWQIREQQDYDELMDYGRFKKKVLDLINEKAPQNKEDMRALRHVKLVFGEVEEEQISHFVTSFFYAAYDARQDAFDLDLVRRRIEDFSYYQRYTVQYTEPVLYGEGGTIKINRTQRALFEQATVGCLERMAETQDVSVDPDDLVAIKVLLHHDITIKDNLLLRLLPYSFYSIHLREEGPLGREYSLFDFISERFEFRREELINALRVCMDKPVDYVDVCWKQWCVYLIRHEVVSEYPRVIDKMVSMKCGNSAFRIIQALLENTETRGMVLKDAVLRQCDIEKRQFVYEQLAMEKTMDTFVREGLERDFDEMKDGLKRRGLWMLLARGSMKGLECICEHIEWIEDRISFRHYPLSALPLLVTVYSKALDLPHRYWSDYSGILNAFEEIAEENDEGWEAVNEAFEKLIAEDEKKYQHLNWYIRDWGIKRMEKGSPVLTLMEAKKLLDYDPRGTLAQ